ncbi:hypothetical protein THRCLA_23214 [Thraustotheca clavata]|uniref:Ubiquitin-like domain-containing protein n=1 Tax=Thraustotheca clavata TaxID=74557 RepID=A0A1V9Y9F6_9STRA|nr:hypothetical protein THRCLA_23214 [Thraustotheca clavata]
MANKNRLVWYILVDDQGEPYKGTRASSVDIPSSYVIDQFAKAVKAEYSDSHLAGIAPSDLLVYANKTAFDEGNSLEEDESIQNYGRSKKDALWVVVPSNDLAATLAPSVFWW